MKRKKTPYMWAYVREWVINAFLKKDETVRSHKTQMWIPDIRNQRTHLYVCIDSLERIHKKLMRNTCYLDRYYAFLWLQCRTWVSSNTAIIIIFIIENAILFHVADKIESFKFGLVIFMRVRLERNKIKTNCRNELLHAFQRQNKDEMNLESVLCATQSKSTNQIRKV